MLGLGALVWAGLAVGGLGLLLNVEETFVGFAALDLISGPRHPPSLYTYTPYETGTLYMALVSAPLVALLGNSWLALRASALLHTLLTLWLVMRLARRWLGPRPALWAGLLVAMAPASYLVRTQQHLGDTADMIPLMLLPWLVAAALPDATATRRGLLGLLIGLSSGLAISFSLAALPATVALVILLRAGRQLDAAASAAALGGALLGFGLPLFNHLAYGVAIFEVRGHQPDAWLSGPARWAASLWRLVTGQYGGFDYGGAAGEAPWVEVAYRNLTLLLWLALVLPRWRAWLAVGRAQLPGQPKAELPPLAAPLLLYGGYLGAYLTTQIQSHYLLLLLLPAEVMMLAHVVEAGVARGGRWRQAALAALLVIAAANVAPLAPAWSLWHQPLWRAPASDGRWDWRIWRTARWSTRDTPAGRFGRGQELGEEALALPAHAGWQALRGYGYGLVWGRDGDPAAVLEELQLLERDEGARRLVLEGIGECYGQRFSWSDRWRDVADGLPRPERLALLTGWGDGLGWRLWHRPAQFLPLLDPFDDPEERRAVLAGLTRRLARICSDPDQREARLQALYETWPAARETR